MTRLYCGNGSLCYHRAQEYNYSCRDTLHTHTQFLLFPHSSWLHRPNGFTEEVFSEGTAVKCLRAVFHVTHTSGVPEPPWEEPRTQTPVSTTPPVSLWRYSCCHFCCMTCCSFDLWVWTQMRCVQLYHMIYRCFCLHQWIKHVAHVLCVIWTRIKRRKRQSIRSNLVSARK